IIGRSVIESALIQLWSRRADVLGGTAIFSPSGTRCDSFPTLSAISFLPDSWHVLPPCRPKRFAWICPSPSILRTGTRPSQGRFGRLSNPYPSTQSHLRGSD